MIGGVMPVPVAVAILAVGISVATIVHALATGRLSFQGRTRADRAGTPWRYRLGIALACVWALAIALLALPLVF